eukprot:31582-Prorocentrum_lima.AAC.1
MEMSPTIPLPPLRQLVDQICPSISITPRHADTIPGTMEPHGLHSFPPTTTGIYNAVECLATVT